jgi:hypothetical protein
MPKSISNMKRDKVNPLKKPRTKKVNLKSLDKQMDTYYSRYIRLRDSEDGYNCKCISCGKIAPIKEMQNGHYKRRGQSLCNPTKYDERNTNAQCVYCNLRLRGNESSYAVALEEKYGFGILQELEIKSKQIFKVSAAWYIEKIAYYKKKVKEMDINNLWS